MLKRPDGTVITSAEIKGLRGSTGTAPAQTTLTPCAASPDMDGHFYLRDGERVCCWCGVVREKHGKDAVARKRHEPLPAAMGSFKP